MAGHAHNGVYLSWFEQARMDLLGTFIDPEHDWKVHGLIVARNEVDYRGPVHLGDQVEVDCWCDRIGSKSFDLRYALFVANNGERQLRTEGRSVMVCFDYLRNSAIPVPRLWRDALATMSQNNDKPDT